MYETKYHTQNLTDKGFLITGGAGFIGSNIVEYLLKFGAKKVRVLDNFSTGNRANLRDFENDNRLEIIEGDIRDLVSCQKACEDIDYVSHQAALGSVPRSIKDPITTNEVNIGGFLNILLAARDKNIQRLVYAASSSTYGDSKELPKVEDNIGKPLSPYAVTKYVNELYADVFAKTYGVETIGLRYFNVFGPKQSPEGAYAAVIPLFIKAIKEGQPAFINGDGEQTRDFTFVENAVQANIKALLTDNKNTTNQVFNIACGEKTSLNQLWKYINKIANKSIEPFYRESRIGDIHDSLANIEKASKLLGYEPKYSLFEGLIKTFYNY
jgi:UDP-N-acetylglucosamine/UDP-N-acetylgalactosamine 4-epimerase